MFIAIKKKKWVIVVCFFGILMIYAFLANYNDTGMGKDAVIHSDVADAPSVAPNSSSTQPSSDLGITVKAKALINKLSLGFSSDAEIKAFQAEKKEWEAARGYVNDADEYGGYSEAILLDLAKNGDVRALTALAQLRYRTHGFDGAANLYYKAATRGSTEALLRLGIIEDTSHYGNAKTETEKKLSMLRVLAWYRVASLRGDRGPELMMGNAFIRMNNIHLSEAENKQIAASAEAIYRRMQDERNKLGLGEFDNSVPDSVKRFFDIQEKENRAKASKQM